MIRRPTVACARCGKLRTVSQRILCRSCSVGAYKTGTLDRWPAVGPQARTLAEFAAEFAHLESQFTYLQICQKMGYSQLSSSLRVTIIKAQKAGLLPKRTPLCGWGPG